MDNYLVSLNKLKEELKKMDQLILHSKKEIDEAYKVIDTSDKSIKSNKNEISKIEFKIANYDNTLKQVSKKSKKDFSHKAIISVLGFACLELLFSSVFLTQELLLSLTTFIGFLAPAGYLFHAFTKYSNDQASILTSKLIKKERIDIFNARIDDLKTKNQQLENAIIKNTTKAIIYEYRFPDVVSKKEELNEGIRKIEQDRQVNYEQAINVALTKEIEEILNDSYSNSGFVRSLKKQ